MNTAMDRDTRIRARLEQHWGASERGDIETEHAIYSKDAILDYPQSGERFRVGQRSRRSAAGTRLNAISLSCGSGAAATCG
ncbi:MAG: hypothetical protein ACRDOK_13130 [Streptosporangiaceae bacterium]